MKGGAISTTGLPAHTRPCNLSRGEATQRRGARVGAERGEVMCEPRAL
jgi:hypothetical protein